ncbi:ankyrin repeat-containing protein NPR4-like [Solanum lycopersicum]|uniref:PGG domain-containing protein n=1 Tax=Solanum lycopersicum TaxID=4081 RepID=A0A3Q7F0X0_SOLLC|nr:ankyrin repeat-containing protein NPR4-like [Solanum lycopersicum]
MKSESSHEIESVFEDCEDNEQFWSEEEGSDVENQLFNTVIFVNEEELDCITVAQILQSAAIKDRWEIAEPILMKEQSLVHSGDYGEGSETLLHIAAAAKSIGFVRELIKLMKVGDLEIGRNTAFHVAATVGHIEIAKAMREKNKNLPNIFNEEEILAITLAAEAGHKAMVTYLNEVTDYDVIKQQLLVLLEITIQNEMYEVALNIFNKDRKLVVTKMLEDRNINLLKTLSEKSIAISDASSPVWRVLKLQKLLPERYEVEKQARLLLEKLWAKCQRRGEDQIKLYELVTKEILGHSAAKAGNLGFLLVVARDYPEIMCSFDDKGYTLLHVAVLYREEKVFSLIHRIGGMKNIIFQMFDHDGNNILHLAGKLGEPQKNVQSNAVKEEEKIMPPSFLRISGAALQMQREILWFKEVEKLVPPSYQKRKNKDGKTPRELFTEEHKILLKEGERWMKDTGNSCMIVSTLIATMVFAAGFTVPGGYNSDNGIPILLNLIGFKVFVISDAVALFTSIVSIIMFLSILTSRYAEDDFRVSLPAKLFFGLTMLFVSIVIMLVAFTATFVLIYSSHIGWEPKLIAACAGVPVALFGCLQYNLWFDVAKSTCSSKFLFRSGKHKLD